MPSRDAIRAGGLDGLPDTGSLMARLMEGSPSSYLRPGLGESLRFRTSCPSVSWVPPLWKLVPTRENGGSPGRVIMWFTLGTSQERSRERKLRAPRELFTSRVLKQLRVRGSRFHPDTFGTHLYEQSRRKSGSYTERMGILVWKMSFL